MAREFANLTGDELVYDLYTYAKHHSKGMHIKIDVFLLTQWKNRLAVVRGIVERKNLLGYRTYNKFKKK